MASRYRLAALTLVLLVGAVGCDEPLELPIGSCSSLASHLTRCESVSAPEAAIERRCLQYPTDFEAHVQCSAFPECGRFQACITEARASVDPARRARRLSHYLEDLRGALATDDFAGAETVCRGLATDPDLDDESLARCRGLPARAVEVWVKRLQGLRDAPTTADAGLVECREAERFARATSEFAVATVRRVCAEAALAVEVADVRRTSEFEPDAGPPMGCDHAIALARSGGTPYAVMALGTLLDVCALTPARRLLGAEKGACDHRFVRIGSWLAQAELDAAPDIAVLRRLARERCGK